MVKDDNKQFIMHENAFNYKCDTLVADETANIKLVSLGKHD